MPFIIPASHYEVATWKRVLGGGWLVIPFQVLFLVRSWSKHRLAYGQILVKIWSKVGQNLVNFSWGGGKIVVEREVLCPWHHICRSCVKGADKMAFTCGLQSTDNDEDVGN